MESNSVKNKGDDVILRTSALTKRFGTLEAVKNLISNAVDSMPDGGTLSIITAMKLREGKPYVTVRVGDTGRGIPPEEMTLIFEPFYTTKIQPKGTGLGLPIAKKVIEDYGGFIQAESSPSGSVFSLSFPQDTTASRAGVG